MVRSLSRLTPLLLLAGCATLDEGAPRINLLSTAEERTMGAQLAEQINQQEKLLADPDIQSYINEIGNRLARTVDRRDVEYQFRVIDSPDTVNAFALPGGYMYIYTGLMLLCENEAELASVMAHEIAHVAARHHGEALTRQYGISMIGALVLGENPGAAREMTANLLASSGQMFFSRQAEREADRLGLTYLWRAGYRPDAMVDFMEKMGRGENRPPGFVYQLFASHPASAERVEYLRALTAQFPYEERMARPVLAERYRERVLDRLRP